METLQRTANRGSISTGYDIDNSLKVEADDSQYIDDRHYTAGNQKKLTISFWFKRTELGQNQMPYEQSSLQARIYLRSTDDLYITAFENSGWTIITNRLFRDTSAWYHCVFQLDTTQSTAADRMKLWINGQQETSFSSASYPTQNADTYFNTNQSAKVGGGGAGLYFSGYMSEFFFIDDQALQASDFGEYDSDSGIWIPKEYDGTFGGQSYYLEFKNASNLADRSDGLSNGVSLSVQNISAADQATDTPTNNFCTWFPLWTFPIGRTISEGATNVDGSSAWGGCKGTIGVTNGKWYWENKASGNDTIIGWQTDNCIPESNENSMHNIKDTIGFYQDGNNVWIRDETSGRTDATTTGSNASGQIIGMALDLDSSPQTATFYRNGSAISSAINIDGLTGKTIFPFMSQYNQNAESNFGGFCTYTISSAASDENGYGTFEYAPPSGYYALCTKNLAEYG